MKKTLRLICLLVALLTAMTMTTAMAACGHDDLTAPFEAGTRETYKQYSSTHHEVHWASKFVCRTCGDSFWMDWSMEWFPHEFSGNKCTKCGYTRGGSSSTTCNHNDSSYHESTPVGSVGYATYTASSHYVERHYKITCKVCGKVIDSDYIGHTPEAHSFNTSGKCTKCGYSRGGSTQATATPRPSSSSSNSFYVKTDVRFSGGQTTIQWVDTSYNGSYEVRAYLVGYEDVVWSSYLGSTSSKALTSGDLVPGQSYQIVVKRSTGAEARAIVTIPAASAFADGKLSAASVKVSIEFRYRQPGDTYQEARYTASLNAATIQRRVRRGVDVADNEYGLYYKVDPPSLSHERTYYTMIVIRDPYGYTQSFHNDETTYLTDGFHYWYCVGEGYWYGLHQAYGYIPSGTYYVDLYWDGMLVNTTPFYLR